MNKKRPQPECVADGLATIHEASLYLGVCRSTLYALMAQNVLPSAKLGRARRIPWAALRSLARSGPRSP